MKFFIGDNLRLAGKTRHGKNRMTNLDGQDSSILSTKACVIPLREDRRDEWRWIDLPSDEHMEIIEHIQ